MTYHELASDDELNDVQLKTMDALWRATRSDGVSESDAKDVETLVREGRVSAARKRLTEARRAARDGEPG